MIQGKCIIMAICCSGLWGDILHIKALKRAWLPLDELIVALALQNVWLNLQLGVNCGEQQKKKKKKKKTKVGTGNRIHIKRLPDIAAQRAIRHHVQTLEFCRASPVSGYESH